VKRLVLSLLVVFSLATGSACATESERFADAEPIPDSIVAYAQGKGVVGAKLSCATMRYAHGVLGDEIEAGCLIVVDESDQAFTIELPQSQVFEDLEPRIADMDDDGRNEVIVIRSDEGLGAALVIYTIKNNELVELVATPPIGRAFRWLAPVGIADFNNDGRSDIAYVQTPHIGGILKIWSITENGFEQQAQLRGFSNHSIGSKRVSTAKIIDYNNDGVADIALPDQSRQNIVWLTLLPQLRVLDSKPYQQSYFD